MLYLLPLPRLAVLDIFTYNDSMPKNLTHFPKLLFKEILECYLRFLENIEIGGDFNERNNKKYTQQNARNTR